MNVLAAGIVEEATSDSESDKNPHAVALGRLGGKSNHSLRGLLLAPLFEPFLHATIYD